MSTLLTTHAAAQEVGVSSNTLRIYERLGLLTPARDSSGRRVYSCDDVERAKGVAKQRAAMRGSGLRNRQQVMP